MDNLLKKIEDLRQRFLKIKELLDIDAQAVKARELRQKMNATDFWDNQEEAVKVSKEAEDLLANVDTWEKIGEEIRELEELTALAEREDNSDLSIEDLSQDLEYKYQELEKHFSHLEFLSFFSEEYDKNNALISIHAGTGGIDAQDWAQMLERMYFRFSERQGFKVEILDRNYGNEAGIKSVDFKISGQYAYGYLKSENGVHRLLRNSPFNADGLRQTSFALVEVIPEIQDETINLKDEDLRIDVFKSSGPGGQSVNTTDSAVRIVHLPTNLTVACQSERSQHQNKENALKLLKAKLNQKLLLEKEAKEKSLKGDNNKAEWGKQIRSYFFYGNKLIKDHRSNYETTDVESVLDGDLQLFMEAYLRFLKQ